MNVHDHSGRIYNAHETPHKKSETPIGRGVSLIWYSDGSAELRGYEQDTYLDAKQLKVLFFALAARYATKGTLDLSQIKGKPFFLKDE